MNTKTRKIMMLVAILMFCLFSLEQLTSAQETNKCITVKGKFTDVTRDGSTTGTITRAGILNGRTETVFSPAFAFTPDPTTVSFTGDYTIITPRGVLITHNVYIFDFARGLGAGIYRIDPYASNGIFAYATGVLYVNGKAPVPSTVEGDISGEICFGNPFGK